MEPQQHTNPRTVKWNPHDFPPVEKPTIGIKFFNVNSGEEKVCDTEALITAYYNSSNLHVNAMVGQDLGWRLAKETVARMRSIQGDDDQIEKIVRKFRLNDETEVTDSHVLTYIFHEDLKKAQRAEDTKQGAFQRKYEEDIRSLDAPQATSDDNEDTNQTQPAATPPRDVRLTPAQQKQEEDARKREANLEAGRPINEGIDAPEIPQDDTPEEEVLADLEAEEIAENGTTGEGQSTEEETPPQEESSSESTEEQPPLKPAKKTVAKKDKKADNKNQS